jgi:hypothetical protein
MSKQDDLARRNFLLAPAGAAGFPLVGSQIATADEEAGEPAVSFQKETGPESSLRPMTAHNNLHALLFHCTFWNFEVWV